MKQILNTFRTRLSVVKVMNWCALMVAVYSINVTCFGSHHQPEVPEGARKLRRF